jgi:hypothetical protein
MFPRFFSTLSNSKFKLVVRYNEYNNNLVNAIVNSYWKKFIVEKEHNPVLGQYTLNMELDSDTEHDTIKTIFTNTGVFCYTERNKV